MTGVVCSGYRPLQGAHADPPKEGLLIASDIYNEIPQACCPTGTHGQKKYLPYIMVVSMLVLPAAAMGARGRHDGAGSLLGFSPPVKTEPGLLVGRHYSCLRIIRSMWSTMAASDIKGPGSQQAYMHSHVAGHLIISDAARSSRSRPSLAVWCVCACAVYSATKNY